MRQCHRLSSRYITKCETLLALTPRSMSIFSPLMRYGENLVHQFRIAYESLLDCQA